MSSADRPSCTFCRLPKASLHCEVCQDDLCRSCVERLAPESFALLSSTPENLTYAQYCPRCYDEVVAPALASYEETLERAKNVGFWAKSYRGHVPVLAKARTEVHVEGARDRDDALLRLGFQAAELGFNGLIQGELRGEKFRSGNDPRGYQSMRWSGRALPVKVDEGKLERAEFREAHWRVLHHR